MDQQAIVLSRNNVAEIVETLDDYTSVEMFMEDFSYMLNEHDALVLVIDVLDNPTTRILSHVVTLGTFHANAICDKLNETTFETVTQR